MRLIDADALKERLIQNITLTNAIDRSFSEAPSIDIVRCKECKHNPWNYDAEKPLEYTCIWDDDFADREQTPNDFCSYGERKGE